MKLKIWKCHTQASKVIRAEKTLNGTANPGGVKWCGPYKFANQFGWWIFPPVDIDICWKGGKNYEYKLIKPYTDEDFHLVNSLIKQSDNINTSKWLPPGGRTKFTWGMVEENVVQVWTGIIFQTPPNWCLQIRSPINFAPNPKYSIMEGILETDWMQYDIWFNIVFNKKNELVQLRKDQFPPLAQVIPIQRDGFDKKWELEVETINRKSEEANKVFEYWIQYNDKKFGHGGKQFVTEDGKVTKDGGTFYKERAHILKEKKRKPWLINRRRRHIPDCKHQ